MTAMQPIAATAAEPVTPFTIPESNEALGEELTRLAGHINAAQYRFLKLLAALVEREAWLGGSGFKSPAHWLNYSCGIDLGAAREKVRVAKCLATLPQIDAAFSTGAISYSKVRAMTRSATPENEAFLLQIAEHGTAQHVEKLVRKYGRACRLAAPREEREQYEARAFSWCYDDDGMLVFRGRLPAAEGVAFLKAMQVLVQASNPPATNTTSWHQRPNPPAAQGNVSAETSLAPSGSPPCTLESDDNHFPLAASTAKRLACDAALVTVLEDGTGSALNVGRKTRVVPPAMRRALTLRDQGCRFPGCCETRFVDAHHIHHWCDGGETKLDNLVLLCRRHHRLVHQEGFQILKQATGFAFLRPNGRPFPQALVPQFPACCGHAEGALALEREHASQGLHINERTALTRWLGETMDYDLAVGGLMRMAHKCR